jgi:Tripartite tricarboxylate transporter TctB family
LAVTHTPALALHLSKNLLAGLMFIAFGLAGVWLARDLDLGTASDMGPGYFPLIVCALLLALGGALAVTALMRAGEAAEGWAWKPLLLITLSALAFAFLLKPLGLVGTLAVTTALASAAGTLLRPLPLAALAAVLIAVNVGIFVLALKMPIPLWPSVF